MKFLILTLFTFLIGFNLQSEQPTVYGKLWISVESQDSASGTEVDMVSNASRLGIKGSMNFGEGIEAIYQAEYEVDPVDGTADESKDRTFKQKESSKKHSHRMKNSTPWNKGMKNKYKQSEWNEESKRKLKEKLDKEPAIKCIHCGKVGKGLSMQRWHFGNCKHRHNSKRI